MKRKLALLLACSMALSLTACGGGNKAAETMAAPETTTTAAVEVAKGESRDDAVETTAVEAAGGDMDALIEAAKAEGELTVHGSCEKEYLSAACQNFEKLYGIKAEYQGLSTSEVYTKISEEAGKPPADIWFGGTTDPYNEAVADGLLMEYNTINAKNLIGDQHKDSTNCWYGIYKGILGSMVSTEELDCLGLEAPKTWDDLIKEEYKGLIILSNPNTAGTAELLINIMVQMKGHDEAMEYFKVLDKNISQYTKSGPGPSKMVGPDECVISIGFPHDGICQTLQGYDNVQLIAPEGGASFGVGATAILNGRAHPNATKPWIEHALPPDCVDHAKKNGSYQFLVLSNATQSEKTMKLGLDMNSTIDYNLEDAKESGVKYVEDSFMALGSSSDSAGSSHSLTEQAGLLPMSGTWKRNMA